MNFSHAKMSNDFLTCKGKVMMDNCGDSLGSATEEVGFSTVLRRALDCATQDGAGGHKAAR